MIAEKEVSAVELLNATFDRIDNVDPKVRAYNSLCKDLALETAKRVDEKVAKGEDFPLLAGVPLTLTIH